MKKTIGGVAVVALALAMGSLAAGTPAMANSVTIGVSPGGIAFGYSDGYWDRDHHWHGWRNAHEAAQFRAANRSHYFARKHVVVANQGWRDTDRYWEHR